MSLELILFLLVAALAIFAAAFMLISRNAVHAALFLVTNMICLSFFYLLLNAPFLAMVQITVYAGAIMVLFMFVIMLLGSDKLGELPGKYKRLPIIGVGAATLLMIVAYFVIVQGNIGSLKPVAKPPLLRVVHVGFNVPPVDVYLNDQRVTSGLAYENQTAFSEVKAGAFNALVFAAKADGSAIDPAKDGPVLASALTLEPGTATTVIATADRLIVVPQNLDNILRDDKFRYTVVNALPDEAPANFIRIDPSNPNPAPEDRSRYIQILAPALKYGDVSKTIEAAPGDYVVAWEVQGQRIPAPEAIKARNNTSELVVLYAEAVPGANPPRYELGELNLATRNAEFFGGPTSIGESLFTTYLLPFELVSLLLLVAMVGAIILTREESVRRVRQRVVVSKGMNVRRMNQASATFGMAPEKPATPAPVLTSQNNEGAAD